MNPFLINNSPIFLGVLDGPSNQRKGTRLFSKKVMFSFIFLMTIS
jgi:hypothetical protein